MHRLLLRHFTHLHAENTSPAPTETEIKARPKTNGLDLIGEVLTCENCCEFITANEVALDKELQTLTDRELLELFWDGSVSKMVVKEIIKSRAKPLFDSDGNLMPDLREIVTETLASIRREIS